MEKYCIENEYLKAEFIAFGATITSLVEKETNTDIVLSLKDNEDYKTMQNGNMGAIVGRSANRTGNGKFVLNGETYSLLQNNGPNSLHGGAENFAYQMWHVVEQTSDSITFSYYSKDMIAGYPGNLQVLVTYFLSENNLVLKMTGRSDKDTLFNPTNHAYFNLNGDHRDILNHELYVPTHCMNLNDMNGMASEFMINVDYSGFDFTEFRSIGKNIELGDGNMNGGIDHNYSYETMEEKLVSAIRNDKLMLAVFSDLPGVQIYTANFLGPVNGRTGTYGPHQGICMEPQFCPNAINYKDYLKPIMRKDTTITHTIVYQITKR